MSRILFSILFISCALNSQAQIAEGVSKPVLVGSPKANEPNRAESISKPIHFISKSDREVSSSLSNLVNFSSTAVETSVVPTRQIAAAKGEADPEEKAFKIETVPAYYALIIGESEYKNANANLASLDRPTKDAQALFHTLTEKYYFSLSQTKILTNASRAEIIDAFDELSKKVTSKDNLLVFYAGHGVWDEPMKVGYWLPSDALLDKKYSWISNSSIKDYIGGINSKHTLLITDACFSGSIFKTRGEENLSDYGMAKLYQMPSRKAMTSGNLKSVPDQSKFFEFLNKRLNDNTQTYISARELFNSLYTAVLNNTNSVPLYGVIQDTGDEGGEFIFIKK